MQTAECRVLGVRVDCVDMGAALERIEGMVDAGGHHLVVTVNPEFVMSAQTNLDFARVLDSADLSLADGTGVVWAMRRMGCRLSRPVAGVDLVEPLAAMCARRGFPLFLLGAAEGVAQDLASRLSAAHPGLEVAAAAGSPDPSADAGLVKAIRDHATRVLLVAYGAPRQELWIDRMRESLDVAVAVGVGGAFDYLTGRVERAPVWMRRLGLEWFYRLFRQPWRLRRMAVLPFYVIRVLAIRDLRSGS